ncbi:protein LAZY 1-like [Cynara cardunculus var. scolymus]|uniref:protein LAZY 1-like n=1 Tax=Cynara cardunculus var. scolymus TaxID=59895 RepID=UPI000D631458|nr:protein LAZY 1-like [Cynara cardunculus var. scolymus]
MKLPDWMQHKFRQTNNEHLTEFAPRNSCACLMGKPSLDDLQYYPKSHYHAKAPSNTHIDNQFRKSFACMETARADDERMEEESGAAVSELFHGFLAIGTLATETITTEPATPTFATAVENIMGKETEATENELKLINDELEKVLGPEGKEDRSNDSSGRNSCVNVGRSSPGGTITLGGRPLENNENGAAVCPLQGYLFGSVIGLPETATAKKEHRTSLGELFQRTKMVEEVTGPKSNIGEKQKQKETDKSAVHLMKKILKGRKLYSSSWRSTASSGGTLDSASADKKPRKILQMFHRKVHPEGLVVAPKSENHSKHVTVGNFTNAEYKYRNQMLSEDITVFPLVDASKRSANCTKSNIPHSAYCMSESDGSRECWIKSDADYLVLEL